MVMNGSSVVQKLNAWTSELGKWGPRLALVCVCARSRVWLFATPWPVHDSSVHGDSPDKNTGVGRHALLQRIFQTQGSNSGLLHCRQILYSEPPGKSQSLALLNTKSMTSLCLWCSSTKSGWYLYLLHRGRDRLYEIIMNRAKQC